MPAHALGERCSCDEKPGVHAQLESPAAGMQVLGLVWPLSDNHMSGSQAGAGKLQSARCTLATSALCIPAGCLVTLITCRIALGWRDANASYSPQIHQKAIWLQGVHCPRSGSIFLVRTSTFVASMKTGFKVEKAFKYSSLQVVLHSNAQHYAGAAAMLELLSEPLYILAAVQLRFRLRALVDTAAIVAKSAATVALLQLTALPPALALSWAQMAFAAVTLMYYGTAYAQDMPSWLSGVDSADTAVCRQQDEPHAAPQTQQADGRHTKPKAADTAPTAGTARQRKLGSRPAATTSPAQDHDARDSAQQRLLHGPTLWLCGSFSLQVSGSAAALSSYSSGPGSCLTHR